jgi:hypothetical protein
VESSPNQRIWEKHAHTHVGYQSLERTCASDFAQRPYWKGRVYIPYSPKENKVHKRERGVRLHSYSPHQLPSSFYKRRGMREKILTHTDLVHSISIHKYIPPQYALTPSVSSIHIRTQTDEASAYSTEISTRQRGRYLLRRIQRNWMNRY